MQELEIEGMQHGEFYISEIILIKINLILMILDCEPYKSCLELIIKRQVKNSE